MALVASHQSAINLRHNNDLHSKYNNKSPSCEKRVLSLVALGLGAALALPALAAGEGKTVIAPGYLPEHTLESKAIAYGSYYVVDFMLEEVRSLRMTEPFQLVDGKPMPVYPARFPLWQSCFRIHSFQEEIEMILGLNN